MKKQYKIKGRPKTFKAKRNPRPLWIQAHHPCGTIVNQRKNTSWNHASALCDRMMAHSDVEAIAIIDGNVPESDLMFPPEQAVWARWSSEPDSVCQFSVKA